MAVPRHRGAAVAATSLAALLLAACTTTPTGEHRSLIPLPWLHKPAPRHPAAPELPAAGSGLASYNKDEGAGQDRATGLMDLPDAEVKAEPYNKWANRRYSVFGQSYTPIGQDEAFVQRGKASWYGVKFHGQKTSSGELYDMHKMTAAHPTLPLPSYARVTSLDNGKSVVVRINDRGPFHGNRVIDVSYAAALKLGLLGKGSHMVEIERLFPNDPSRIATMRRAATSLVQSATPEIDALVREDRLQADSAAVAEVADKQYYVQLGSYARAGTAEAMRSKLAGLGVELGTLEVVRAGSVDRLYGGPFASRAEARRAMRKLPGMLGLKPLVVKR